MATIAAFAMCESVAALGLVLSLMWGRQVDVLLLVASRSWVR
ncbi:MAG TPA: hypothetical protein VLF19_05340 [Methylomirabilota bacterium]|nr:hypothetical protein [Methylomirabilota bacterium]